jgi:hypothetical protein
VLEDKEISRLLEIAASDGKKSTVLLHTERN